MQTEPYLWSAESFTSWIIECKFDKQATILANNITKWIKQVEAAGLTWRKTYINTLQMILFLDLRLDNNESEEAQLSYVAFVTALTSTVN